MFLAASRHHHRHSTAGNGNGTTTSTGNWWLLLDCLHPVPAPFYLRRRQPRVCLSPAIAAVQMAPGISIIYRLWKPFTFVIYAGLTGTGSTQRVREREGDTLRYTSQVGNNKYNETVAKAIIKSLNEISLPFSYCSRYLPHAFLSPSLSIWPTVSVSDVIIPVSFVFFSTWLDFIIWQSFITHTYIYKTQ